MTAQSPNSDVVITSASLTDGNATMIMIAVMGQMKRIAVSNTCFTVDPHTDLCFKTTCCL